MKNLFFLVCFFNALFAVAQLSSHNANENFVMYSIDASSVVNTLDASDNDAFAFIEANDDYKAGPINSSREGLLDILSNDTMNDELIDFARVTIKIVDNDGLLGISVDKKGYFRIPAKTKGGIYNVTYSVCNNNNVNNCDTAVAKVMVNDGKSRDLGFNIVKSNSIGIDSNSKKIKNAEIVMSPRFF